MLIILLLVLLGIYVLLNSSSNNRDENQSYHENSSEEHSSDQSPHNQTPQPKPTPEKFNLDLYSFYELRNKLSNYYKGKVFSAEHMDSIILGSPTCPHDGYPVFKADARYNGILYNKAVVCEKCKTLFFTSKKKSTSIIDFTLNEATLYVIRAHTVGPYPKHHTECLTGIIKGANAKKIPININFCYECNFYYIYEREFELYKLKYGEEIMGNFDFSPLQSQPLKNIYRQTESIIHKYGYNVNVNSPLNQMQRVNILENLMQQNIISKEAIKAYLDYFIRRNKNVPRMHDAVAKWESDLQWLIKQKFDSDREMNIKDIRPRH